MKIQLDMYQTLAVAVLVLLLGNYLKKKIYFLLKFCIPAPVIGGLIFAIMVEFYAILCLLASFLMLNSL